MVNFFLIPLQYRVLFVNMVALGWTAFLSTLNARQHAFIEIKDPVPGNIQ
jgi:hypothetical protein